MILWYFIYLIRTLDAMDELSLNIFVVCRSTNILIIHNIISNFLAYFRITISFFFFLQTISIFVVVIRILSYGLVHAFHYTLGIYYLIILLIQNRFIIFVYLYTHIRKYNKYILCIFFYQTKYNIMFMYVNM